jgi:hypothetical protein
MRPNIKKELMARLEGPDPMEVTSRWFVKELSKARARWEELTPVEQNFLNLVRGAYKKWLAAQTRH